MKSPHWDQSAMEHNESKLGSSKQGRNFSTTRAHSETHNETQVKAVRTGVGNVNKLANSTNDAKGALSSKPNKQV